MEPSYGEFCHILHFPHFPPSGLYWSIARAAGLSSLVSSGHRDFTQGTGQQQQHCFRAYCASKVAWAFGIFLPDFCPISLCPITGQIYIYLNTDNV